MPDHTPADDARLISAAYIEFHVKRDAENLRLLERDTRYLAKAVGSFALFLMDAVVIPERHGISWTHGWVEVDFLRRTNPQFRATLGRRDQYRRQALGRTLRPRARLRRTAHEVTSMLCLAYTVEHGRHTDADVPEAVSLMLNTFRRRFCHSSDRKRNA
ncbi:hypothetical protein [Actinacidiphila glaucinigra]|uniref:hypothetical protein n=1 Tax=Actinacidiphila glaucinigra TaxID=235986 RepID=UPI00366C1613